MTDRTMKGDEVEEIRFAAETVLCAGFNLSDVLTLCEFHRLLSARVKELEEERRGLLDYIQQLEGATQT